MTEAKTEVERILDDIDSVVKRGAWNKNLTIRDNNSGYQRVPSKDYFCELLKNRNISERNIQDLNKKAEIVSSQIDWDCLGFPGGLILSLVPTIAVPLVLHEYTSVSNNDLLGLGCALAIVCLLIFTIVGYGIGHALNSTPQRQREKREFEECCNGIASSLL